MGLVELVEISRAGGFPHPATTKAINSDGTEA